MPPSTHACVTDEAGRAVGGRHVGDERHRAATDPLGRCVDRVRAASADRDVHALRPRAPPRSRSRALATPPRPPPACPRYRDPRSLLESLSCGQWMGPLVSRNDATCRPVRNAMISAQIATAVSSGVRAPTSSPIGDMTRAISASSRAVLAQAHQRAPRACGANPSRRCSRRRSSPPPRSRARRTCGRASGRTPHRAVRARRRSWRGSGRASR